jgi:trigger factor
METTAERTDTHVVKLTIEVPVEEFDQDLDQTYRSISRQVKIPGFRSGKIPKPIIDAQVGRDVVLEEFVNATVPSYVRRAMGDEDLAPIGDPEIDLEQLEPGKPFIFTATVEVRPRVELSEEEYSGLPVERPSVEVAEGEIDDWIERLRQRFAELEPVGRPSKDGDFVAINLTVDVGGSPVDAATREDYLYAIGSGEFGEALDRELVAKRPGDILTFVDALPERFGEDANSPASFRVLVKDVKGVKLPDADDDFAKSASEFDTLQELRADLRTKLGELKEREATGVIRDRALQSLIDLVDVELPDSLVEDEARHRITHAEERAEQLGLPLEQMLEIQGWDRERLTEDSRAHAIRAITGDLALEGVARSAELEVTAEDIGREISALAQAYGRDAKELAKALERTGQIVTLAGDIIRTKALDLVVERADIQPGSPEGQTAEPEESKESVT